jgi:putative membrane protein
MLWVKAFHIVFMVTWFAGLFYLPRLFVYHSMATDKTSMTPGAVITLITGFWMLYDYAWGFYKQAGWLHAKLFLVAILVAYHLYCGYLLQCFKHDRNKHSHVFYRWLNEFPVVILIGVVILAVVRPI